MDAILDFIHSSAGVRHNLLLNGNTMLDLRISYEISKQTRYDFKYSFQYTLNVYTTTANYSLACCKMIEHLNSETMPRPTDERARQRDCVLDKTRGRRFVDVAVPEHGPASDIPRTVSPRKVPLNTNI